MEITASSKTPIIERRVQSIYFPQNGECAHATLTSILVHRSEYLGDRTENWVLRVEDGKETCRFNTRHLESIVWLEDK